MNQTVTLPYSMMSQGLLICCTVDGFDYFFLEWAKTVPADGRPDSEVQQMIEDDPDAMRTLESRARQLLADERARFMEDLH